MIENFILNKFYFFQNARMQKKTFLKKKQQFKSLMFMPCVCVCIISIDDTQKNIFLNKHNVKTNTNEHKHFKNFKTEDTKFFFFF